MAKKPPPTRDNAGPVQERYRRLAVIREPFLTKAQKCAKLTIPALVPPDGKYNRRRFKTPYQSIGARGVNNLASKLLMVLFPPNSPFFRLTIGQFDLERLVIEMATEIATVNQLQPEAFEQLVDTLRAQCVGEVESNLAAVEQAVMREFELLNNRPTDIEALKQLIVAGNVLRFCPPGEETAPRIYSLNHYVVKRDLNGLVLEIITKEGITPISVDPEVRLACGIPEDEENLEQEYELYTRIRRAEDTAGEHWAVSQELNGVEVPESAGKYDIDNCPWLALRWTKVDGEDYGRGHVEEYEGSLISLEGLSRSLLEGAAAASRSLVFVRPNSADGTRAKDVARAENGQVVTGNANDVTFLHSDKYHDLRTPAEQIQKLTQDLGFAFLLTSSVQRDAERVTAQEVRLMAQELETALGGVYTTLGQEYQLPITTNLIKSMQKRKSIPPLPKDVKPTILTGMEAMGRNTDLNRLDVFMNALRQLPPQEVFMRVNISELIKRYGAAVGVNIDGLIVPEEQIQAMKEAQAQAESQQAMMERLGPPAIQAGAKMMQQQSQSM